MNYNNKKKRTQRLLQSKLSSTSNYLNISNKNIVLQVPQSLSNNIDLATGVPDDYVKKQIIPTLLLYFDAAFIKEMENEKAYLVKLYFLFEKDD